MKNPHNGPAPQTNLVKAASKAAKELNNRLKIGLSAVIFLVALIGGWSASAQISGAIVASGTLVVESNIKSIQHPTGGIVSQILVRNGDTVSAGQVMVRLDDTQLRSRLAIINSQLSQLIGRIARLEATRDDLEQPIFPDGFKAESAENSTIATAEDQLFRAQKTSKLRRTAQLLERINQLQREIEALESQRRAKHHELELIKEEKQRVQGLHDRKLIPTTRLLSIKRDVTRIEGEHGALTARKASLAGQINETRLQIHSLDDDARSTSQEQLREAQARVAELSERAIAANDQLSRVEIRAPRAGLVHDLSIHTLGGVIEPAQQIMLIVQQDEALHVDTQVSRNDIDQVYRGQPAKLRFPAFNQRTTPELEGHILRISADLKTDRRSGAPHYVVRIALAKNTKQKLDGLRLIPGMPVEAFFETAPRTLLSYLLKPVTDNFNRTFRED